MARRAQRLDALYGYVNACILQAARDNAVEPLNDAMRVLETLRDSWDSIAAAPGQASVRGAA